MKTLTDHLTQYAAYHQDHRNVVTHFVGIPMIVLAVATLLSRPTLDVGGLVLTPVMLVSALSLWFYLRLDLRFGIRHGGATGHQHLGWASGLLRKARLFGCRPAWVCLWLAGSSSSWATTLKVRSPPLWTTW